MSLTVIKAGILDTIQDQGRYGNQATGINPTGAMDQFSAQLANCLLGKQMHGAVIEMHFPAPILRFNENAIICITGADFHPSIDKIEIPINQPVLISNGATLSFSKIKSGTRCYLATFGDLKLKKWLNSYSTNVRASAGGFEGRALKTGDVLRFEEKFALDQKLGGRPCKVLPWKARPDAETATEAIEVICGKEWHWLEGKSQQAFGRIVFKISNIADRMGYRLSGDELAVKEQTQMVSSGVTFGTIQLLPNGQLIVLMADHQTTGGYPRVANVISAHLPALAQMRPNDCFTFKIVDNKKAEKRLLQQHQYLLSVQQAAQYKIDNFCS